MTHHLHIAFSADAGRLSLVVKAQNGAGWKTLATLSQAGEGTMFLDWQAMIFALQYAAQHGAKRATLYSHLPCIEAMQARRWVTDGRYKAPCIVITDDSYVYNLTAWRLILGMGGAVEFVKIAEDRNEAGS